MDQGTAFGGKAIHCFNGGLFAPDSALERLHVPNHLFCQPQQGASEEALRARKLTKAYVDTAIAAAEALRARKLTVFYLCATYNYAADLSEGGLQGEQRVDRVFVSQEGAFLLAQWKVVASTLSITDRTDGRALSKALRTLAPAGNPALMDQVITLGAELSACEADIATAEAAMNDRTFALYGLTAAERRLVEQG